MSILRRSTESLTEDPIREEMFSVERLEQYAAYLATELKVTVQIKRGRSLLPELKKNGRELLDAYFSLAEVIRNKQSVSPAAEWFVDNFHIVEDQIRGIQKDLPANYYRELPKLAEGELKGYPRVYAIALAIIAHTDSRLDSELLKRFLIAFQKVSPLHIGELWAVAITLRLVLVQHLTPLAALIVDARLNRAKADDLADKLLQVAVTSQAGDLVSMLTRGMGKPEHFDRSFIVQLVQRLRDQDPDVWPAFDWLEKQLQSLGTNTVQVIQFEHQRQAASQVTVGNIIASMRLLSTLDWRDFFETVSVVDPILAQDPAKAYAQMDFSTRDRYRHSIERIARSTKTNESDVTTRAVDLARAASHKTPSDERRQHVGYYLYGNGLYEFEKSFGYRAPPRIRFLRFVERFPSLVYFTSVSLLTALLVLPAIFYSYWWFGLLAIVPASEFALSLFNFYISLLLKPKPLPKMNMDLGIPHTAKTFVVIPTLLSRESVVHSLIDHLEVQYLANQDPHIYFALLGDFTDADSEVVDSDAMILSAARAGIAALNERYAARDDHPRFYLFHRRRLWNSCEEKWIGWERKRGKLSEFNRLLRGDQNTTFVARDIAKELAAQIKYVITLDSDTELPRDSAHRLIGTIEHPLNRPYFNPQYRRVTEGYGILQPRVSVSLMSAARSHFARIFSGNIGLDPYTTAVSDVYQDLFAEGSFTGKGLYVIDAFEAALADRVPENSVLSHDLFEGSYARSALVTDVELFDEYPSDYDSFLKRLHRWTRGDWQIAPWLFSRVKNAHGKRVANDLSLISRWKIFDNLRRSLVAPTVLACLLAVWTVIPGNSWLWTSALLAFLSFSIYAPLLILNFRNFFSDFTLKLEQFVLVIAFMPIQAWAQVDAIVRIFYRKLVSKKHLLEWVSFAQVEIENQEKSSLVDSLDRGLMIGLIITILIACTNQAALISAAPFLCLWLVTPFMRTWLKLPPQTRQRPLEIPEIASFRMYARLTWRFFEKFIDAEGNWLAPDNFQEDPTPVVAHRTSPTNIGLQLLATVSAYDFGYVGLYEFLERTENTFRTIEKLPKFHGHLFNWYDTKTLEPLRPQYISTVDSGNLAGHLLTLKQSCADFLRGPLQNAQGKTGLGDTLAFALERLRHLEGVHLTNGAFSLRQLFKSVEKTFEMVKTASWHTLVQRLIEAHDMMSAFDLEPDSERFLPLRTWLGVALHQAEEHLRDESFMSADNVHSRLRAIMDQCDLLVTEMDFGFLFDESRKIFVIGFNVESASLDNSYYDLLASESRLASFVAIAKGEVPQEHWFRLGRAMTMVKGSRVLIAWTATMFEYLMPLLVMRRYPNTLLEETYLSVVRRQIDYGKLHGIPWGISEAGFNARDLNLNYQYGPFGIPGLGLKRGLSDDMVISPYSTMLAAMVDPRSALENLKHLERVGMLSTYGFFEAVDYTPDRLPKNQKNFIIRSFMVHHQGMSLLAINNIVNDHVMQKRFHNEPIVKATELLLQEKIPGRVKISKPRAEEVHADVSHQFPSSAKPRIYTDVNLSTPRVQLLSNGTYSVMVSSAGSGYSKCGPLSISRWREDATRDHWGQFFYIRNRDNGNYWSAGVHPVVTKPDGFEAIFSEDKVDLRRVDGDFVTHTEILVSPEDNVEVRRISLTNNSDEDAEFDVTSYLETTLARPNDDAAHPAFSNLFVQTEFVTSDSVLLATRRRRSNSEKQVWAFHVAVVDGESVSALQFETDRSRFLGRGHNPSAPVSIVEGRPLSNTAGSVLDPIFSLRASVKVPAGGTVRVCFATGVADSREDALRSADKYHDVHIFARECDIAWTASQVQLRHLNIAPDQAHVFQRLAGRVIYSSNALRSRSHVLAQNTKTQSSLWAYGISGDVPIILMRINDEKDMAMVRELLHGHEYLRLKGLAIDLVILNERPPSYIQSLQEELQRQIRMSGSQALLDKSGGVFIRRADLMPESDILLLKSVARVILSAAKGTLDEQLRRRIVMPALPGALSAVPTKAKHLAPLSEDPDLQFFNGLGGFTPEGREYVIILREGQWTPAPWINVIANSHDFGFQISESGAGYTWSANSRENRLTTWSNDAVSDPVSEVIYIRDEESGEYWSPTPLPIRESEVYKIFHGQGYTRFEHTSHGIEQELCVFVALDAEVKVSRLRLKNLDSKVRRLSVTNYVEWVLGFQRGVSAPAVITEEDDQCGALLARNPYNNEFAGRVAFVDMSESERTFTCDRQEFLGRNGSTEKPAAMTRVELSGRSGAGLDPCAAQQAVFDLAPGEEREIIMLLGQVESANEIKRIVNFYKKSTNVAVAMKNIISYWDRTLGAIEIRTPDLAMNTLVNRWLIYQTQSCRLWARSAFYQSGGAFGFRDQLQDVMALIYSDSNLAREQILRAAERQFLEGDVQHWWHPPTGRGVRTRFSDDLVWLPYVVSFYLKVTNDTSILKEEISFIEGPLLETGVDDSYTQPATSAQSATIFEHCARALDRSLKVGRHGLPLMGSGDWNDGMNRVGHEGQGESVWMGWFLYSALERFIPICKLSQDLERAKLYEEHLKLLKHSIEENAWDGNWYRRAYFDNGASLGSASNEECRIDSIAQSWAVLSGAGDPQRAARAMAAVDEHLVHRGDGLVKLFTPPFDKGAMDPGYIKGYVPGVRENGGQYTHAAIWTAMAYAALGDGERASEIYSLLNPINHAATRSGLSKYKVEPYVMAADIYGLSPHIGRGGWTWYTGSSSWMYRAALESILGFDLRGNILRIKPCIPRHWRGFEIIYRSTTTEYHINVNNLVGETSLGSKAPHIEVDGVVLDSLDIPLAEDGVRHHIRVQL